MIYVSQHPFCAKGDGIENDGPAIQSAIDFAYKKGGDTVVLESGKTFLTAGIVIRDNVTLLFEDSATLYQSPDPEHYTKPAGDGYVHYRPAFGHNFSEKIKWSHNWYVNYPLIFAPENTHNFAVRGNGTIRMMDVTDPEKVIKICPIGFYRCRDFEICDVHITNYHSYAIMPFTSSDGLIKNIKIDNWSYGNGDGVCLMNCRNMRVTGCTMFTGDDSVYIFSSYKDPRKSEWWSSDEPQASENIEIDHNDLKSNHCKGFGMILWGIDCPDLEKTEVRNVYVHHNHFETMGNWLYNPYTDRGGYPPVTSVRFEDNVIDGIEANFFETQISDMNYYHSMTQMQNIAFEQGRVFWAMKKKCDENSVGVIKKGENEEAPYGYIKSFNKGDVAIYQGVYISKDRPCYFKADVKTDGCECRLFVRDLDTDELIAGLPFDNTEYEQKILYFSVPESGNYRIGLENGNAKNGIASIKFAMLGNHESAFGYDSVIFDRGKVIFKYNDNLFKR